MRCSQETQAGCLSEKYTGACVERSQTKGGGGQGVAGGGGGGGAGVD